LDSISLRMQPGGAEGAKFDFFFGDFEGFSEARLVIRTPTGRKLS
jgi:hypothetical protein